MSAEGSTLVRENRVNIVMHSKTPFSGLERHELTGLLRIDSRESCQNASSGTSTPRINMTSAP
eukprot:2365810-Pyramimonas_sp.AAC.1